MTSTARLVIMASGSGRTLENLATLCAAGQLDADIVQVVVSQSGLGAEQKARRLGLSCVEVGRSSHPQAASRDQALLDVWDQFNPDWIVLAGWLQLVPVPERYEGKILNIHPALLPSYGGAGFYGQHVHQAVATDQRRYSGCTVHFATEAYDEGPIVLQDYVELGEQVQPGQIATTVFAAELRAYPEALRALISGQARWQQGKVVWS